MFLIMYDDSCMCLILRLSLLSFCKQYRVLCGCLSTFLLKISGIQTKKSRRRCKRNYHIKLEIIIFIHSLILQRRSYEN